MLQFCYTVRRMGRPKSLADPKIVKELNVLMAEGHSPRFIAAALGAKGFKVSFSTVRGYLRDKPRMIADVITRNEELQKQVVQEGLDICGQLTKINNDAREILEKTKAKGDDKTALKAIETVMKQLELQARLLGRLSENKTEVNVGVSLEEREIEEMLKRMRLWVSTKKSS